MTITRYFELHESALPPGPVEVTARKAGEMRTATNTFGSLGQKADSRDDSAEWEPYVGKRVRITAPETSLGYQTDASLQNGGLRILKVTDVEKL